MYYISLQEYDGISHKTVFVTTGHTPQDVWQTINNYKPVQGSWLEYGFRDRYGETVLVKETL